MRVFRSASRRHAALILSTTALIANGAQAQDTKKAPEQVIVTGYGSQVELVPAYEGGQVARGGRVGMFGNLDNMDTPFSLTSYTAELMLDQQARSVADVLQNDPVVRPARGFGNFQEVYIIRGFPVYSDDMTYNGVYGILPRQYVAAEFLERVEVFRGANSFLNGAAPSGSGIAGAINLVPKRAPSEPLNRLTAGFESEGHVYGAVDIARRFGQNGETGIRVNATHRDGETAVEGQDRALTALSLGLDHQGDRLRLSADVGFQDHDIDAPRPSVTPLGAIPEPPKAKSNFAQPWTYSHERQLFAVVRAEYDVTDAVTAWVAGGTRSGKEANVLSNPSALANGDTSAYRFDNSRKDRIWSGEAGVRAEFETGGIGHRLVVSGSIYSLSARNAYAFSSFAGFAGNLYNPVAVTPPTPDFFVGGDLDDPLVTETRDARSIAVADMISLFDKRLLITVGARYQTLENKSFDYNTGGFLSGYDKSAVTPMGGIVFKATESLSLYANYIESLVPGEVAPATSGSTPVSNAGEVFSPYKADQIEAGVKYDGGSFGATLAVFTLSKPIAFVENGTFGINGSQRHRGAELSLYGQVFDSVRVIGGLTLLDATMTRTAGGAFDGNDPVGVPDFQANINLEWDVPFLPGLTLDGRFVHTSSQFADSANTIDVSSWNRLDLGVRYGLEIGGKDVVLRARLDNVTNKNYWASVGGYPGSNYLVLGNPRTLSISASLDL
ncbi:TonB-dependent siderophore receptor [Iodidimonas sp. SYSU 1G8]|uniref:TonB-dependent receptor n=1 Tax=Iodidimonas sp. SYSU 1G8 TaxID=3133967 RepID=UPI0031FED8C1